MLDGAEIPITAFRDAILYTAKEIAQTIGANAAHPYRSMLYGRSANIPNFGTSPTVDQNGIEFVGVFDTIRDADTLSVMTLQPSQTIEDISDSFFSDISIYNYSLVGNYVQFPPTTNNVFFEGCIWSNSAQVTLYEADGLCPLPEATEALLCDGVTARASQVGWIDGANTSTNYVQLYAQGLLNLANIGQTNIPLASRNTIAG